jgi:chromosome segregation ATPase
MLTHAGHAAVSVVKQRIAITNAENAALALRSQQLQLQIDKTAAELDVYKEQTNQVRQVLSVAEKQEVDTEKYLGSIESEQDAIERKRKACAEEARAARATRQRTLQGPPVAQPQPSAGGAAAGGTASVLQGAVQFVLNFAFRMTDPGSD